MSEKKGTYVWRLKMMHPGMAKLCRETENDTIWKSYVQNCQNTCRCRLATGRKSRGLTHCYCGKTTRPAGRCSTEERWVMIVIKPSSTDSDHEKGWNVIIIIIRRVAAAHLDHMRHVGAHQDRSHLAQVLSPHCHRQDRGRGVFGSHRTAPGYRLRQRRARPGHCGEWSQHSPEGDRFVTHSCRGTMSSCTRWADSIFPSSGTFFLPRDQAFDRPKKETNYEGLAYLGEYHLTWAACQANETIYNLLLEQGAGKLTLNSFINTSIQYMSIMSSYSRSQRSRHLRQQCAAHGRDLQQDGK